MSGRLVATTVVRGAAPGDVHGELVVLDLDTRERVSGLILREGADDTGRGGPRGLRGVSCTADAVVVATWDELWVLDPHLTLRARHRSPWLRHAHEIALAGDRLFVASTAFDTVLGLDLRTGRFDWGLCVRVIGGALRAERFDPRGSAGPAPGDSIHLNQVAVRGEDLFLAGRGCPWLLRLRSDQLDAVAELPAGTHNAQPDGQGILYNDTESDAVAGDGPEGPWAIPAPRYDPGQLLGLSGPGEARQGFARGLVRLGPNRVAGGTSPATVAVYDTERLGVVDVIPLSLDVRHAVHGLAIWPWDLPPGLRAPIGGFTGFAATSPGQG